MNTVKTQMIKFAIAVNSDSKQMTTVLKSVVNNSDKLTIICADMLDNGNGMRFIAYGTLSKMDDLVRDIAMEISVCDRDDSSVDIIHMPCGSKEGRATHIKYNKHLDWVNEDTSRIATSDIEVIVEAMYKKYLTGLEDPISITYINNVVTKNFKAIPTPKQPNDRSGGSRAASNTTVGPKAIVSHPTFLKDGQKSRPSTPRPKNNQFTRTRNLINSELAKRDREAACSSGFSHVAVAGCGA